VYVNVKDEDEATGVTVRLFCAEFPPLVNVPRFAPSYRVTVWVPSNLGPVIVTVQVEDATRRVPLEQPEKANVPGPLVYPKLDGFVPLKLFDSEIGLTPTDTGV
jgi:hypothetical protein